MNREAYCNTLVLHQRILPVLHKPKVPVHVYPKPQENTWLFFK